MPRKQFCDRPIRRFAEGETPRILIATGALKALFEDAIAPFLDRAHFTFVSTTLEDIVNNISGHHGLIGCPRDVFCKEILEAGAPTLCWVHNGGAGIDELLFDEFVDSDIEFTNGRIIQGPEVADHALGLLLALTRNIARVLRNTPRPHPRPIELRGKRAVITGPGGIGMCIAERAVGFGLRLDAVDPDYLPMTNLFDRVFPPEALHDALAEADIVFNATPATRITNPLYDAAAFRAMKKGVYFINVSRGTTVDTEALLAAVENGHLGAVGLDVSDPEPLPDDHPLRFKENVVLTPHIAGLSDHNRARLFTLMAENIDRFLANRPLFNVVDKIKGY